MRGLHAQMACVWEATARKPGNVHRFRDFADTTYLDFIASAAAIGPVFATERAVGEIVLAGVRATRLVAPANTNLGILLLLAPLAVAESGSDLRAGVESVLASLTIRDASQAYEAIRLVNPGGLGEVEEGDVSGEPDRGLRELMALAADRDAVARQYAEGYRDVFDVGIPASRDGLARTGHLEGGIIAAHLVLMSRFPDTLIARKLGFAEARESATRAGEVLAAGWPDTAAGRARCRELDAWLRERGNARNPGATADLIAACLFAMLRAGELSLPQPRFFLPEAAWE
jgi:triphosphoribosyl-dephospho-CoA synthase